MWTLLIIGLGLSVVVMFLRLRELERALRDLASHTHLHTTHALKELEDRVETLESDTGIWTHKSSLSDAVDSVLNRVDATEQSIGMSTQDRAIAQTLHALQERVDVVEKGTAMLLDGAPRDNGDREPSVQSQSAFKQLVRRVAPAPLQRVYEFTINFSDQFWIGRLNASESEIAHVKEHSECLVALTIEHWRTHTVARVRVAPWSTQSTLPRWPHLPDSPRWPNRQQMPAPERVKRLYSGQANETSSYSVLWELPMDQLARLQLRCHANTLMLCAIYGRFEHRPDEYLHHWDHYPIEHNVFLVVPLDQAKLEQFQRPDDDKSDFGPEHWEYFAEPWRACYDNPEENPDGSDSNGIYWTLWIHDFQKEADDATCQ